jgi:transcriptional regulator with XRE-family HTH domain
MLTRDIGPDTLHKELNRYLNATDLSLSQVAKNLGVSKGHLSEIKNGKTDPALNTGLRILKLCGLNLEELKAWSHFYNRSISDEYLEVHADVDRVFGQKLNEKASFRLAHDFDFLNAYTDIVNRQDEGIPLIQLRIEYGKHIEQKLDSFVELGILEKKEDQMGKVYCSGKVSPIVTKNASFSLIQNIVEQQHIQFQNGDYEGDSKFFYNDLSDQGIRELDKLLQEMTARAADIMRNHKKHRLDGGNRFIFQMLFGRTQK